MAGGSTFTCTSHKIFAWVKLFNLLNRPKKLAPQAARFNDPSAIWASLREAGAKWILPPRTLGCTLHRMKHSTISPSWRGPKRINQLMSDWRGPKRRNQLMSDWRKFEPGFDYGNPIHVSPKLRLQRYIIQIHISV